MLTGAATVLIWHNLIKPLGGVFGIYELLPAFLLGCLAIFVVSKLTPSPRRKFTMISITIRSTTCAPSVIWKSCWKTA